MSTLSDDQLALALDNKYSDEWRYVNATGKWYVWNKRQWKEDKTRLVYRLIRKCLRKRAENLEKVCNKCIDLDLSSSIVLAPEGAELVDIEVLRSARKINAVFSLCHSNAHFAIEADVWNRHPYLLGTPEGTFDLGTNRLRAALPEDYITKFTTATLSNGYDKEKAKLWEAFLNTTFLNDPELIGYVQRLCGLALYGEFLEHILVFLFGSGRNGKSVLLSVLARLLGDYAVVAPPSMFVVQRNQQHPTDMAMLQGARLVIAQETRSDDQWDDQKIKMLTGGDPITARFMRQDFFTFMPQYLLMAAGNHKPSLKVVNEAIRRRIQALPFLSTVSKEDEDVKLAKKIADQEGDQVMRWCVDGWLDYQARGRKLDPPACVAEASKTYFESEDIVDQWLEEECIVTPADGRATMKERPWVEAVVLYKSYEKWARFRGYGAGTQRSLSKRLDEKGYTQHKRNVGQGHYWLQLKEVNVEDHEDDGAFHYREYQGREPIQ